MKSHILLVQHNLNLVSPNKEKILKNSLNKDCLTVSTVSSVYIIKWTVIIIFSNLPFK